MTTEDLTAAVLRHISEFLEVDLTDVALDDSLVESVGGLTSVKMMELVLYLEECFGFEFDETVAEQLDSLRDLVAYIEKNMGKATPVA